MHYAGSNLKLDTCEPALGTLENQGSWKAATHDTGVSGLVRGVKMF